MIDEGHGLGIAEFGPTSHVQFGQFDEPVIFKDARQRNREREQQLLEVGNESRRSSRRRNNDEMADDVQMHDDDNRHDRDQSFQAETMDESGIFHPLNMERRAHDDRNIYGQRSAPILAPYPETNRIPTGSDPVMLNAMLERQYEGRGRGYSVPYREEKRWEQERER
ncbi:MAG: hypothetical protein Q9187_009294 [Circinaria calcarea]